MTNRQLFRRFKQTGSFSDLRKLMYAETRELQRQILTTKDFKIYAKKDTPYYRFQDSIDALRQESLPLIVKMSDIYQALKADEQFRKTEAGKAAFEQIREIAKFFKDFDTYMKLAIKAVDGLPIMIPWILKKKEDEVDALSSEFEGEKKEQKNVKATFLKWIDSQGLPRFEQYWFPMPGDTEEERLGKLRRVYDKLTEAYIRGGITRERFSEVAARERARNDLRGMGYEIQRIAAIKIIKTAASPIEGLAELGKQVEELGNKYLPVIKDTYEDLTLAWEDDKYRKNLQILNKLMKGTGGGVGFFEMFNDVFVGTTSSMIRDFVGAEGKQPAEIKDVLEKEKVTIKTEKEKAESGPKEKVRPELETQEPEKEKVKEEISDKDVSEVETMRNLLDEILGRILEVRPEKGSEVEKVRTRAKELADAILQRRKKETAVLRGLSRYAQHPLLEEIRAIVDEAKNLAKEEGVNIEDLEEKTDELDTKLDDMLAEIGTTFKNTTNDQIGAVSRILEALRNKKIEFDEDKIIPYLEEPANKFRTDYFKGVDEVLQELATDDEKERKFFQGDKAIQQEIVDTILDKVKAVWESVQDSLVNSLLKGLGQVSTANLKRLSIIAQEQPNREQIDSFVKSYLNDEHMERILKDAFQKTIDKNREEIKGLVEKERELVTQKSSVLINLFKRRLTYVS